MLLLTLNRLWEHLLFLLNVATIILFGYVLCRSASSYTAKQGSNYVYRPEK